MLIHKTGDLFTTKLEAIGHGVNCKGKMGSGIAVTVRTLYPDVFSIYARYCNGPGLSGGDVLVVKALKDGRLVFNLASQEEEGANAKYGFLQESVHNALEHCREEEIEGLALPRIGAGVGKLEWDKVLKILEEEAEKFPEIKLEIWSQNR